MLELLPDEGKAARDRGFHLSNRAVDGLVRSIEHDCDLGDTEQRVCIEEVREKHLSCGEVLLVKWRAVGVDRFEIAVSTDNAVGRFPRVDAGMATARTRRMLPELLESPLDAGIERLGIQLEQAKVNELAEHPAERWLSLRHTLEFFGSLTVTTRSFRSSTQERERGAGGETAPITPFPTPDRQKV